MDLRTNGQTSNIIRVSLKKAADGTPLTGLSSSSSGLIISTIANNEATATTYTQAGSTTETITTLGTFAAPTATKCRFKEVDATNHPGLYEIQIADARFAVSSAKKLVISISGAASLLATDYEVLLASVNWFDAVRFGLTALPNANANAAGGLPVSAAGALDLDEMNVDIEAIQVSTAGLTFTSAGKVDANALSINGVSTSPVTTIKAVQGLATDGVVPTVTNLTNAPTAGDLTATMKTSVQTAADAAITANAVITEIEADTDTLTTGVIVTTNNDKTGYALTAAYDAAKTAAAAGAQMDLVAAPNATAIAAFVTALLTTAMTESYSALHGAPTLAQALFEILQNVGEFSITGTTITVKKRDGTTTAFTATLDDATTPTSRTRAT
jgi:hypothetical protein